MARRFYNRLYTGGWINILRVIAGSARGHKLRTVEGFNTRPTTDRVKESLFNILAPWVVDSCVLDLYAGTGSIGIEALSRGAGSAVFVDRERASITVIKDNLTRTRFSDRSEVMCTDVETAIDRLATKKRYFDLIFMDPPYSMDLVPKTLEMLASAGLLREDGIIVAERDRRDFAPDRVGDYVLYREQKYGDTVLSFYRMFQEDRCQKGGSSDNV